MIQRLLACLLIGLVAAGCSSPAKKAAEKPPHKPVPQMADMSGDVSFEAFLGRLRKAVAAHDIQAVAEMMTTDFGYRLDTPDGEGPGVFQYWDDELLWPQVQAVLGQRFVPKGNFMVAPPEFATDPNYHGYRAGITFAGGAWRFAYFVTDPPP